MKKDKFIFILAILGLLIMHAFLGLKSVHSLSPTYDEPVHLTSGYLCLKLKYYEYNGYGHPALSEMWPALPLLFMNPIIPVHHPRWVNRKSKPLNIYWFADMFTFHNRVPFEKMMAAGRTFQLGMSLLFGLFLAWIAFRLGGMGASLVTTSFWAFSPTFLAHGTLINTDLAFAVFFFVFFMMLTLKRTVLVDVLTGVALGLAFCSKFTAVAIGPILGLCALLEYKWKLKHIFSSQNLKSAGLASIGFILTLLLIYQISGLSVFMGGIRNVFTLVDAGRSSFLMGEYSLDGFPHYFIVAFLVKTPPAVILALLLSLFLLLKKDHGIPSLYWVPALLYFVIASVSKVHIGQRHIMAVYPFLFLMIGLGARYHKTVLKVAMPLLIIWTGIGTLRASPHYLSYFNEWVDGADYLSDSNIDWGQGLKELSHELTPEDKKRGIYFSYFGAPSPHLYGIKYLNVFSDRIVGHQDDRKDPSVQPLKFAISVTNKQATYYPDRTIFKWLDSYTPIKVIADSIYLYDFSNEPEALARLEHYSMRSYGPSKSN